MLITIKTVSEELKDDGSPKHLEWEAVGADGKETKPKIYPAIQVNEQWIHFEDRWDEFKNAKDKTYDIERASIKIGQRTWMPVIKAVEVKDILKQEAVREVQAMVQDDRQVSIEGQVALKEIGELLRDGKENHRDWILTEHARLVDLYFIKLYDLMNKFVYGAKDVKETEKIPDKETVSEHTRMDDSGGGIKTTEGPIDLDWLKESLKTLAWQNKDVISFLCEAFGIEPKPSLTETIRQLSKGQAGSFINEINARLKDLKEKMEKEQESE